MARSRSERRHNDWTHRFNKRQHSFHWRRKTWQCDFSATDLRKLAALESSFQELDDYEPGVRPGGYPLTMRRRPSNYSF